MLHMRHVSVLGLLDLPKSVWANKTDLEKKNAEW